MSRCVDEVELERFATLFPGHGDRCGLDRDAAFPLQVHGVEHLVLAGPVIDRPSLLQETVGQGALPMVDVGDDREVADFHGVGDR